MAIINKTNTDLVMNALNTVITRHIVDGYRFTMGSHVYGSVSDVHLMFNHKHKRLAVIYIDDTLVDVEMKLKLPYGTIYPMKRTVDAMVLCVGYVDNFNEWQHPNIYIRDVQLTSSTTFVKVGEHKCIYKELNEKVAQEITKNYNRYDRNHLTLNETVISNVPESIKNFAKTRWGFKKAKDFRVIISGNGLIKYRVEALSANLRFKPVFEIWRDEIKQIVKKGKRTVQKHYL